MQKQLNIREFEHYFGENTLKKGLSIFRKNELILEKKRERGEYFFSVEGKEILLQVKRSGEKINEYTCSCGKENCEHICAAMFYFQREVFTLLGENADQRKVTNPFKTYCKSVRDKIGGRSGSPDEINARTKEISILLKDKEQGLYTCLAVINECALLSPDSESKKAIDHLITLAKEGLNRHLKRQTNTQQENALVQATLNTVSSNKRFNTKLFSFLIPRAVLFIKDETVFKDLKSNLSKRSSKYHYPGLINDKLTAIYIIEIAEQQLKGRKLKKKENETASEYYIAGATLALCANRLSEAIKILQRGFVNMAAHKPANFIAYVEFIVETARRAKDQTLELFFIRQIFIHDSQVSPALIKRVKGLLDEEDCHVYLNEIIEEIKKSHRDTFDKLSVLLLAEQRYEDLVKEISRQQNKFWLLNEVALKLLPSFNDYLFKVYVKQFQFTISEVTESHYHQKVFNEARRYFDKLPEEPRVKLVGAIASGLGGQSYLRTMIYKVYAI